jgi:hypothetical protein
MPFTFENEKWFPNSIVNQEKINSWNPVRNGEEPYFSHCYSPQPVFILPEIAVNFSWVQQLLGSTISLYQESKTERQLTKKLS